MSVYLIPRNRASIVITTKDRHTSIGRRLSASARWNARMAARVVQEPWDCAEDADTNHRRVALLCLSLLLDEPAFRGGRHVESITWADHPSQSGAQVWLVVFELRSA